MQVEGANKMLERQLREREEAHDLKLQVRDSRALLGSAIKKGHRVGPLRNPVAELCSLGLAHGVCAHTQDELMIQKENLTEKFEAELK